MERTLTLPPPDRRATPLREWLQTLDPDLSRLRLATRGVLATMLASGVLHVAGHRALGLPITVTLLGAALGMMASIAVNDATVPEQRKTALLIAIPTTTSVAAGTILAPYPVWSLAVFVVVVFLSVALQRFGRRGTALGMMGFNAYFFPLFFHARLAALPGLLAGAVVGLAVAYAVRFWLIPERPVWIARRVMRAYPALISRVLGTLAHSLHTGRTPRQVLRIRRALQQLNEGALLVEDHLSRAPADEANVRLRQRAFDLEVAVGRAAAGVRALTEDASLPAEERDTVARALQLGRAAVHGDPAAADAARARLVDVELRAGANRRAAMVVRRLAVALGDLASAVSFEAAAERPIAVAPRGAAPAAPAVTEGFLHPTTRQGIQAAVACAIALVVGRWISDTRWFWAVLAAYLVIAPATTRGEIIVRAWRRTLGTVAGVAVGIGIAVAVQGHRALEFLLLFACVFVGLHVLRRSHTGMVVAFTVLLAMLYSLTGQYSADVLYVRIAETVAGAGIGAVTAVFLMPSKTRTKVRVTFERLLGAMSAVFAELAAAARGHAPPPLDTLRALDRTVQELRTAAEPLTQGRLPVSRDTLEACHATSILAFYARQLSDPALMAAVARAPEAFLDAADAVAANARALEAWFAAGAEGPVRFRRFSVSPDAPGDLTLVGLWFDRIQRTLDELAAQLRSVL